MKWSQIVFLSEEMARNLKKSPETLAYSNSSSATQHLELKGTPIYAYRKMVQELKRKAMRELKLTEKGIVVRSLRPTDLGLSTPEWTFNITSGQWNTMVNTTIANSRFIGIYGVVYLETTAQNISEIKITRGGTTARYWNIEGIILSETPYLFMGNPIDADQNMNMIIQGYGIGTNAAEKMGFIGAVVEKRGLLVGT